MTIGDACRFRIISLCEEKGITVNKLSIISGLTQSTLNNIVSRRNKSLTVSTLKKICDGLEISVMDFFNDEIFSSLEQEIQ